MVKLEDIDIEQIDVAEGLRHNIDEDDLEELAASIARHGVLQPLIVELGGEGRYNLQVGNRRLAAAKMAGLETVPAIVLEEALGAEESLAMRLVENIHREDLDPLDEAAAYVALKDMGVKVSEIARRVGKERTYVSHSMRLLNLHPRVKDIVSQRKIPPEHAKALLRLDPEQQLELAREIMEEGLTLKETRDRIRDRLGIEIKWRLVPIRIEPAVYDRLVQIAPDGDVAELLKQAVERLLSDISQ